MKLSPRPLLLGSIAILTLHTSLLKAEDIWIDLKLDNVEPGGAIPTQKFVKGEVNTGVQSLAVTANNRIEVVKDEPNFPGRSLRFTKTAGDPRTPWAILVNDPTLANSGKFQFSWDACVDSFSSGEKFPGFEALLNFVLLDKTGTPFFNFYYLAGRDESSGIFGTGNKKLGNWLTAQKQHFDVILDLDAKTAVIKIDGDPVGDPFPLPAKADGLRVVEFTDGTGVANYDGKFTATVSNFKMTEL